jgi:hypothetical protein
VKESMPKIFWDRGNFFRRYVADISATCQQWPQKEEKAEGMMRRSEGSSEVGNRPPAYIYV